MPDTRLSTILPRAEVPPPEMPGLSGLMTLAVAVVVVAALFLAQEVLVPITLAILLSFVLAPLVSLLRKLRIGRVPSVLLAVFLALAIILAMGGLIGSQIAQLASEAPRFQATIAQKIETVRHYTIGRIEGFVERFERQAEREAEQEAVAPAVPPVGAVPPAAAPAAPAAAPPAALSPFELAQRVLSPFISPLETTAIVFIVTIFILLQQKDLRDRLIRLLGSKDLHRTTVAMDDAARRLSRYFLAQLALNTSFGCIIGTGLFFIGVPSPLLWGVLAALLRFVPYIGVVLASILPLALAAAVDPGWSTVVWTGLLFFGLEPLMANLAEPLLYGHSTGLSPVSVVIAAIFWSWLWGPIGLILSTPLTLCLVVLGRHIDRFEFFDVLLGDRPALTPVEGFYQRMLAGDPDEAEEQAEALLKDRSLSSYYDEVALKGLQLAAGDALRGVLTPPQVERIRASMMELIEDLGGHADIEAEAGKEGELPDSDRSLAERDLPKEPPPGTLDGGPVSLKPAWQEPSAILCIAGRGPLDEAASAMLAQLLTKHGLGSRLVVHAEVSRSAVRSLDAQGAVMVCISYLEISGNPAHLRYLLRRLRQRLPQAPLLVGLWPADEAVLRDENLRRQIGADYYTSSLREAVDICLEAGREPEETEPTSEPAPSGMEAPGIAGQLSPA